MCCTDGLSGQRQSRRLASLRMYLFVQISSKVPLGNPHPGHIMYYLQKSFIVLQSFLGAFTPLLVAVMENPMPL